MLAVAKPLRYPSLMCRDHVAQVGRWFDQGVLVLGLTEIRERAQLLESAIRMLRKQGKWSKPLPDSDTLNKFAQLQILAHELGHELDRHDKRASPFTHPEAAADYWAGWLDAQRKGSDEELGTIFFATIGCNEQGCSHPSSSKRAEAYRAGFANGRRLVDAARIRHAATSSLPPSPTRSGPTPGEMLVGAGVAAGGVFLLAKVVDALLGGGKTYDPMVNRYRNKHGQFTRG